MRTIPSLGHILERRSRGVEKNLNEQHNVREFREQSEGNYSVRWHCFDGYFSICLEIWFHKKKKERIVNRKSC